MATSPLEGRALVQVRPWRCPCRLHWSFDFFMRRSRHDCCCRTEVWYANRSRARARLPCGPKRLPGRCQDRDGTGDVRVLMMVCVSHDMQWFLLVLCTSCDSNTHRSLSSPWDSPYRLFPDHQLYSIATDATILSLESICSIRRHQLSTKHSAITPAWIACAESHDLRR